MPPVNFRGQRNHFFGKTLLIIDRPGFTRFCRPSDVVFRNGTPINDLPFRVEVPNVKFPNSIAVDSFKKLFCQTLSLGCNAPVRIFHEIWFLAEDKSFNRQYGSSGIPRQNNLLGTSTEAEEADIAKARCLYEILDKNPDLRDKLQIPIDRWIKAKAQKKTIDWITDWNPPDKMIDLGIALEALFVTREDRISNQICHRASWYLGENPTHQQELETELEAIYDYRSAILHNREVGEDVQIGNQSVSISDLVIKTQNLCRKSILQIMEDGDFPDWNILRQRAKAKWASS